MASIIYSFSLWPYFRFLLILLFLISLAASKDPKDNFCRRFAHQTAVIDDKLYIDGGWVNFDDFQTNHVDNPNTWLGYHDLNQLVSYGGESWPDLNIELNKNQSIPTVHGGTLWPDSVNKRFYLYGGEWTSGLAQDPYHILSYDIINDQWDDHGKPDLHPSPKIAAYGAGVGVSETGMGYYYGGWISNASMNGWNDKRTMSSAFYSYSYDTGRFTQAASPDRKARAEGGLVWVPAGDAFGLLVYLGGVVDVDVGGWEKAQRLDEVFVFDATGNRWSMQKATGEIPQGRKKFCVDVAWAKDKSSFNIYLWGGQAIPSPNVNTTAFDDVYILSLPSFIWVKAYPDHHGNATGLNGHYSASCNIVKSMSQMFIIGGTYPDTDNCDGGATMWGQHDFWTGTSQNAGNNETYLAVPSTDTTTNAVPVDVYSVVGGDKDGGATMVGPKAGFSTGNKPLSDLLNRRPSTSRTPTRAISGPTHSSKATPMNMNTPPRALSAGGIVGIAIGCIICLLFIALLAWFCGSKFGRTQEVRRKSESAHTAPVWSSFSEATSPVIMSSPTSPHMVYIGPWAIGNQQQQYMIHASIPPTSPPPPTSPCPPTSPFPPMSPPPPTSPPPPMVISELPANNEHSISTEYKEDVSLQRIRSGSPTSYLID